MRWLLPLILVVALAVCVADPGRVRKPKLPRAALAGRSWTPREITALGRGDARAPEVGDDPATAIAVQRAMFDAVTGTLTWFDDESYN